MLHLCHALWTPKLVHVTDDSSRGGFFLFLGTCCTGEFVWLQCTSKEEQGHALAGAGALWILDLHVVASGT